MSRSRSDSRERESSRRRHRKHKHKSRRSRSRSRSYERSNGSSSGGGGASGIHFNPAFGMPPPQQSGHAHHGGPPPSSSQMGYSASQLLQTNNLLEAEICRLKNAVMAEQGQKQIENQRSQMLQQELRNAQIQRDNANKRVNELMSERRMMMDSKNELNKRINELGIANQMLRTDANAANQAVEGKNEEIRAITYQSEIVRQQMAALNERNATLKTKCETMVAQNRRQYEELEAKQKFVEAAQLNVRKGEADLQCANLEIQRLLRELETSQRVESTSLNDKQAVETILQQKEDEIRIANFKAASDLKAANEKIEKLEARLKLEKPVAHNELTVETIYIAIETIKSTYEKQLARLEEEVEELRQQRDQQQKIEEQNEPPVEEMEQPHQMEELPEYLQTPMRPDPAKMGGVKKTIQCKIKLDTTPTPHQSSSHSDHQDHHQDHPPPRPSSCPPVDSPATWHHRKVPFERLPPMVVPLFGTSSGSTSEAIPSTSSENKNATITVSTVSEEDLLLLGDGHGDMISPNQDLALIEQQLLGN